MNQITVSSDLFPAAQETLAEMFVVDAFLKNPDRNNGNWGLLRSPDGS